MSAQGWNQKKSDVPFRNVDDLEVVRIVNTALSPVKKHTTSYKYAFFKSFLDNIFNVNLENFTLSMDALALRFTEIYWNLTLCYHLRQMPKSERAECTSVEKKLYEFCEKNKFDYSIKNSIFPFESLREDLQVQLVHQIKKEMTRYVVAAFCNDTEGQLYSFDKKEPYIKINPAAYGSCIKFKSDFEKINYYEWIKYLEKVNAEEDSYALANKLDSSTERKNLTPYREILYDFGQRECFYCGRRFNEETVPVDHFIPWSFVKDDKLWNFVLACPECNASKNNTLPQSTFIDSVKKRNVKLSNFKSETVTADFRYYTHERLDEMFRSAQFNGFSGGWMPRNVRFRMREDTGMVQVAEP